MDNLSFRLEAMIMLCLVSGCVAPPSPIHFAPGAPALAIAGLTTCGKEQPPTIEIDPDQPLTIFVHGCAGSAGRFRALAQVFEFHGQQALCFEYDDRESMDKTSRTLGRSIEMLKSRMNNRELTLVGHSQGGLVARRALVSQRIEGGIESDDGFQYQLVTVSSPFAGIAASRVCASTLRHVLTLGISMAICRVASGKKWQEIHERAEFIRQPGTLIAEVNSYIKVVTDEKNTCRKKNEAGNCVKDDFVFSVKEQYYDQVDQGTRVVNELVEAGHVEIVGSENMPPYKLVKVLQEHAILKPTKFEETTALFALLDGLF